MNAQPNIPQGDDLSQVSGALVKFDAVEAGLAELTQRYGNVVYDVTTTEGMDAAKASRAEVREIRIDVENTRKAAKAPLLAIERSLDKRAKQITAALEALETPISDQIKTEESRKEAERQKRIQAELDRVANLTSRVADLRGAIGVVERYRLPAAAIAEHISDLESVTVDGSFEEFEQQAHDAKAATLARLRELHSQAVTAEAERAELEKLRAAQAARDAEAAALQAEKDRIAREAAQVEAARQAEENRRQAEALAAERAAAGRHAAEVRAQQQAEADRLAEARAKLEAEQEILRKAYTKPAPIATPLPSIGRGRKPSKPQIVRVVADHFEVSEELAGLWIGELWG